MFALLLAFIGKQSDKRLLEAEGSFLDPLHLKKKKLTTPPKNHETNKQR